METSIETQVKAVMAARKIINTVSKLKKDVLPKEYDIELVLNDAANTLQFMVIEDKLNDEK